MSCNICKKSRKLKLIEMWYNIDNTLFHFKDNNNKKQLNESSAEDYKSLKSALLLNLTEMYNSMDIFFENCDCETEEEIREFSEEFIGEVIEETVKYFKYDEGAKDTLTSLINESNNKFEAKRIFEEHILDFAIDDICFTEAIQYVSENGMDELLETEEFKVYMDTHDKLKKSLINLVL